MVIVDKFHRLIQLNRNGRCLPGGVPAKRKVSELIGPMSDLFPNTEAEIAGRGA